jgi:hypothetical protein
MATVLCVSGIDYLNLAFHGCCVALALKLQTPERQSSPVFLNRTEICGDRLLGTQNAPSRMAQTKANTAHTARTSSLKARSTTRLSLLSGANLAERSIEPK